MRQCARFGDPGRGEEGDRAQHRQGGLSHQRHGALQGVEREGDGFPLPEPQRHGTRDEGRILLKHLPHADFTVLPLYRFTVLPLYHLTVLPLYRFTVSPAAPLNSSLVIPFIRICFRFTAAEGIRYFISWRVDNINKLRANLVDELAGCLVFHADFCRKMIRFPLIIRLNKSAKTASFSAQICGNNLHKSTGKSKYFIQLQDAASPKSRI